MKAVESFKSGLHFVTLDKHNTHKDMLAIRLEILCLLGGTSGRVWAEKRRELREF